MFLGAEESYFPTRQVVSFLSHQGLRHHGSPTHVGKARYAWRQDLGLIQYEYYSRCRSSKAELWNQ